MVPVNRRIVTNNSKQPHPREPLPAIDTRGRLPIFARRYDMVAATKPTRFDEFELSARDNELLDAFVVKIEAQRAKDGIDRFDPDYDGPLLGDVGRVTIESDDEEDDDKDPPVTGCGLRIYGLWPEASGPMTVALTLARAFDDLLALESAANADDARFYSGLADRIKQAFDDMWRQVAAAILESDGLDTDKNWPAKKKGGARKPSEPAHTANGNGNGKAKQSSRRS